MNMTLLALMPSDPDELGVPAADVEGANVGGGASAVSVGTDSTNGVGDAPVSTPTGCAVVVPTEGLGVGRRVGIDVDTNTIGANVGTGGGVVGPRVGGVGRSVGRGVVGVVTGALVGPNVGLGVGDRVEGLRVVGRADGADELGGAELGCADGSGVGESVGPHVSLVSPPECGPPHTQKPHLRRLLVPYRDSSGHHVRLPVGGTYTGVSAKPMNGGASLVGAHVA